MDLNPNIPVRILVVFSSVGLFFQIVLFQRLFETECVNRMIGGHYDKVEFTSI